MKYLYSGLGVIVWRFVKDRIPGKVLRDAQEEQDVRQNRA